MPKVNVMYFAVFRERAGKSGETVDSSATTVGDLYLSLMPKLALSPNLVRAAVNGEFVENDYAIAEGDTVVFIPPVAGG